MDAYTFNLEDIVAKGMIPVIRRRDILMARVMTREEKSSRERGAPDIAVVTPSGQQMILKRSDITSNYTYLSGRKISLAGWKTSNRYTIFKNDNTRAFAMMIPSNCTITVGEKSANTSGRTNPDYVVALATQDGQIDRSTLGIIPSAMFKKMYHIPNNEIIQRNKGKGHKLFGRGPGGDSERAIQPLETPANNQLNQRQNVKPLRQPLNFAEELNIDTESFDFGDDAIYTQQTPQSKSTDLSGMNITGSLSKSPMQGQMQGSQQTSQNQQVNNQSGYGKYVAIGRLVNQSNQLVGFIIQNNEGKTKQINLNQMMNLCSKKLISNIMLTRQSETNKVFLRGNNMRIESLPAYNI